MINQLKMTIEKLSKTTKLLGKCGLLIIENQDDLKHQYSEIKNILLSLNYQECKDYLEILKALSSLENKIYYIEKGEKLDGLVLEIIAEFEAGIVSIADRKGKSGLITSKWNPDKVSFIIVMTRDQIEKSHPHLFEYVNISQSL